MDPNLIDRIYECAFAPEFWPGALDELARVAEARGGLLVTANMEKSRPGWTASDAVRENVAEYVRRDLHRDNISLVRLLKFGQAGFIGDHEVISREEMEGQALYRDILWPEGLGNTAGTAISATTGDTLMCVVARDRARGQVEPEFVEKLDALRPHLARSALFSARLGLERARAAAETLQLLGLPALVFDRNGRVVAANALIEAEGEHVRWRAWDRVAFVDRFADAAFRRAVDSIADDLLSAVRSFAVRGAEAVAAKVAHVAPIRGVARDLFARSAGVLMLTPVAAPRAPPLDLIQSLFDLTPAEAGVARRLSSGLSLAEIARQSRVSGHTVRTHMRAVFEKTGCSRQAEVVALLGGLAPPGA